MKPILFKSEKDLINFISKLPRDGEISLKGESYNAGDLLDECAELVSKIFRYKEVLIKSSNGVGNNKSFNRFIEAASDNSSQEAMVMYNKAIGELVVEVEELVKHGLPDGAIDSLNNAKTKIEKLKLIRTSIETFRDKLQALMGRIFERHQNVLDTMEKNESVIKLKVPEVKTVISNAIHELELKNDTILDLVNSMNRYCELQILLNQIFLG